MSEWTKVVINPLGLGGFALFLVFSLLARAKRQDERRWMAPAAIVLAAAALIGGLALAWAQVHSNTTAVNGTRKTPQTQTPALNCQSVSQTSTGAASPNVACNQAPVTITIDPSSGQASGAKSQKNSKENGK